MKGTDRENLNIHMSQYQSKHRSRIKSWGAILSGLIIVLVIILLIPFVFKGEQRVALHGPDLSEIKYTEIFFNNGDLQLAGMLILPGGEGPFPVAVIIHGSGTSHRDSKWYLAVAKHLQENEVAVLLPDKRGSAKSEGDWRSASFDDLAGDTISAIEFIKTQDQFDYSAIGIIGMSQGGWIAPLAAVKSEDVSFVVSMSGAAVTTDEQLLYEEINNIIEIGTYSIVAKLIAPLTTYKIQQMDFWRPIAGYDPLPHWEKVEAPSFAALGENDKNVPVEESVDRFRALEKEMLIKIYPDGGHGITDPNSGKVQDKFLNDLTEFIANAGN